MAKFAWTSKEEMTQRARAAEAENACIVRATGKFDSTDVEYDMCHVMRNGSTLTDLTKQLSDKCEKCKVITYWMPDGTALNARRVIADLKLYVPQYPHITHREYNTGWIEIQFREEATKG